jgi:F0F1-type ATP synthase gamma subunit
MTDYSKLDDEITTLNDIRGLVIAYETIASSSMRRIRNSVLANRAFHSGLNEIFQEVAYAYRKEVERLIKKRKLDSRKSLSLLKRNGKTARVLLSANTGLYGDIIDKTCSRFVKEVKEYGGDVIIVGKTGRVFWESTMAKAPFTYFDFPDDRVPMESLKKIIMHARQYERVVVFHGAFRSIVNQDAAATDLSGTGQIGGGGREKKWSYLFEPSLEVIAIFFETQIFASLLEQLFHESRLAKVAGRMVLLDGATAEVDRSLKSFARERRKLQHRLFNRKQLNAIAGVALWET